MAIDAFDCKVCGCAALEDVPGYSSLARVTSDCRPFRGGGSLVVCAKCGAAQALPDEQWFSEIGEIYGNYDIYHQSGGMEQHVFDNSIGVIRKRSDLLVQRLEELTAIPRSGKLLDIGCGNGVTLRAFADRGRWSLHGLEIDDRSLSSLAHIPGFETLHLCPPGEVQESFDVITLIHALEHFPNPYDFLTQIRGKLRDNGVLFIQVPNAAANHFDHVVADHLLHFNPQTLSVLLRRAGFDRIQIFTEWIIKEISVVARLGKDEAQLNPNSTHVDTSHITAQVGWLNRVVRSAQSAASANSCFGLFGSSIAATWLWRAVSDRVQFFVDEDPNRIGRSHLGCPIIGLQQVPAGASVFLALAEPLAHSVQQRLQHLPFHLREPPVINEPNACG